MNWDLWIRRDYWRRLFDEVVNTRLHTKLFLFIAVENDNKKSVPEEVLAEEMESKLLKEYSQLPVARQNEGEIKF